MAPANNGWYFARYEVRTGSDFTGRNSSPALASRLSASETTNGSSASINGDGLAGLICRARASAVGFCAIAVPAAVTANASALSAIRKHRFILRGPHSFIRVFDLQLTSAVELRRSCVRWVSG